MGWLVALCFPPSSFMHLHPMGLTKIEGPQQPCSCVWQLAEWLSPSSCDLSFSSRLDQLSYEETASPCVLSHASHFLIIMSLFLSGLGESWFLSTRGDQLTKPQLLSTWHPCHGVPCKSRIGTKRPPMERGDFLGPNHPSPRGCLLLCSRLCLGPNGWLMWHNTSIHWVLMSMLCFTSGGYLAFRFIRPLHKCLLCMSETLTLLGRITDPKLLNKCKSVSLYSIYKSVSRSNQTLEQFPSHSLTYCYACICLTSLKSTADIYTHF